MRTVVELPAFQRRIDKLLSKAEREELIAFLARNVEAGDEIPGTGGLRKIRFGTGARGKRSGVRIIYYYFDDAAPVYALLIYGKGEQVRLTPEQTRKVAAFAQAIKRAAREKR